jgi:hypothetical protein
MMLFTINGFTICYTGGGKDDDDGGHGIDDLSVDAAAATVGGLAVVANDLPAEQEGDMVARGGEEVGGLPGGEPELGHGDAHLYILVVADSELLIELLLARLAAEKQFGLSREEMEKVLDPKLYTGRCAEQVTRFVEKVRPLLDDAPDRTAEINL